MLTLAASPCNSGGAMGVQPGNPPDGDKDAVSASVDHDAIASCRRRRRGNVPGPEINALCIHGGAIRRPHRLLATQRRASGGGKRTISAIVLFHEERDLATQESVYAKKRHAFFRHMSKENVIYGPLVRKGE